jgi:hypothetical protein
VLTLASLARLVVWLVALQSDLIRPLSEDFSSDDSSQHYVDPSSFKAVDVTAAASMQKISQKALITNDISLRNIG